MFPLTVARVYCSAGVVELDTEIQSVLCIVTPITFVIVSVGIDIRFGLCFVSKYSFTLTPPKSKVLSGFK